MKEPAGRVPAWPAQPDVARVAFLFFFQGERGPSDRPIISRPADPGTFVHGRTLRQHRDRRDGRRPERLRDQSSAPGPVRRDRSACRRPGARDQEPALDHEPEPRPARRGLQGFRDPARPSGPPEAGAGPQGDRAAQRHRRGLPPVRQGPGSPRRPLGPKRRGRRPPRLLRAPGDGPGDRDPDAVRPRSAPGRRSMSTSSSRPSGT